MAAGRKIGMMGRVANDADLITLESAASEFGIEDLRLKVRKGDVHGVYVPDAGGWFVHRADLETRQASP